MAPAVYIGMAVQYRPAKGDVFQDASAVQAATVTYVAPPDADGLVKVDVKVHGRGVPPADKPGVPWLAADTWQAFSAFPIAAPVPQPAAA